MQIKLVVQAIFCSSLLVLSSVASAGKGSASSMSRGFSSSKAPSISTVSKSSRSSIGSFGSFGKSSKPNATRSESVLYRDMEQRQAQANAMKNWDARQAKSSSTTQASGAWNTSASGKSLPPMGQAPSIGAGSANYPNASNTNPAPSVVVQSDRSSMMKGVLAGAVIGSVLSQPHTVYAGGQGSNQAGVPMNGPLPSTEQGEFKQSQITIDDANASPSDAKEADVNRGQTQSDSRVLQTMAAQKDEKTAEPTAEPTAEGTSSFSAWMIGLSLVIGVTWWIRRRWHQIRLAEQRMNPHYTL